MDLEANRTSVRHTFLACVAVFHAVDYLAHPKKSATLRQQFNKQSPEFKIVDDVAHAFKHVQASNPAKPDLMATEVIRRPPAFQAGAFQEDAFDVHGSVTLTNHPNVDLYEVVKAAVAFLQTKLTAGD